MRQVEGSLYAADAASGSSDNHVQASCSQQCEFTGAASQTVKRSVTWEVHCQRHPTDVIERSRAVQWTHVQSRRWGAITPADKSLNDQSCRSSSSATRCSRCRGRRRSMCTARPAASWRSATRRRSRRPTASRASPRAPTRSARWCGARWAPQPVIAVDTGVSGPLCLAAPSATAFTALY